MSKPLVPDEFWASVEPLLRKHPYVPGVGKPRAPDRVCLTGIIFVPKTGLPWEDFPQANGAKPASGTNSTGCFWTTFAVPASSTLRA